MRYFLDGQVARNTISFNVCVLNDTVVLCTNTESTLRLQGLSKHGQAVIVSRTVRSLIPSTNVQHLLSELASLNISRISFVVDCSTVTYFIYSLNDLSFQPPALEIGAESDKKWLYISVLRDKMKYKRRKANV